MKMTHEMLDRLEKLEEKYAVMGQDMLSYLDGLLYADYLTYWDYIHLDTLLSLQTPRTPFPDEHIFIVYHQITELYFKLIIQALEQLIRTPEPGADLFRRQLKRLNSYLENLIQSFEVMVEGMDKDEFLKFRMSLLPASGFQSAQYRKIEILSTDLFRLTHHSRRAAVGPETPVEEVYPQLYWKWGATELATGKKTLTLRQFDRKYAREFILLAKSVADCNLRQLYLRAGAAVREDETVINELRNFDFNANVRWPLVHLRSAVRYLDNKPKVIEATGGTNWQQYLPPRNQRILFFPDLWSEGEQEQWGRKGKLS